MVDKFTYDDGDEAKGDDTFAREPFCIKVKSSLIAGKILSSYFLSQLSLVLLYNVTF